MRRVFAALAMVSLAAVLTAAEREGFSPLKNPTADGDYGIWYVCTDQAYTDRGGYEQTFTFVDPCESLLKRAMAAVLGAPANGQVRGENSP
ncbi:MAG: hypothetical protein PHO07_00225 [Pirellulales bacterium]|nr:hypothetical protein [Thermoguttaceae bacterium]MDD4785570.1 hypothetical protein [Pirellulales bacterium]MDI9443263.1 hypothetical protein [Planctomycetota bacterium]NLZ01533.1 hypothetical protein [Pirellulaceae bacterium]